MVSWSGVFSVMVTPFTSDGQVDLQAFRQNVRQAVTDGVNGLVVAGSTGEFYSLTDVERLRLFEEAKTHAAGTVPVIGGCSALRHDDTLHLARESERVGIDGIMLLPPLFVRPTERETRQFFSDVSQVCSLPILLYNNPVRIGFSVPPSVLASLADTTRVAALKDSSKDITHLRACVRMCGDRVRIFVGFDTLIVAAVSSGAHGVVSMAAQVFGQDVVRVYEVAAQGKLEQANALQDRLTPLYDVMYSGACAPYTAIKWGMKYHSRPGGFPRPPFLPPDEATCRKIEEAVSARNL